MEQKQMTPEMEKVLQMEREYLQQAVKVAEIVRELMLSNYEYVSKRESYENAINEFNAANPQPLVNPENQGQDVTEV